MKETQARIERIKRVSQNIQRLELAVDDSLSAMQPGQALLVRRIEKDRAAQSWQPYLRELWFPVEMPARSIIAVEHPARAQYLPGQRLSLLGPVGQPFQFRHSLRHVLLLAYDTTPAPLLMMLPLLLSRQVSVTLILLGTARDYDARHLPGEVEVIRTDDDLTWPDMVMTLGWADQIFALGKPDSEQAYFSQVMQLVRGWRNDLPQNVIFGLFQTTMPCGVGACQACMLRVRGGGRLACMDGLAFDLTAVRLDVG